MINRALEDALIRRKIPDNREGKTRWIEEVGRPMAEEIIREIMEEAAEKVEFLLWLKNLEAEDL